MTGYTVHTGSNDKFREGWDKVFKSRAPRAKATADTKKRAAKKAPKK